jgi:hypothetical protein
VKSGAALRSAPFLTGELIAREIGGGAALCPFLTLIIRVRLFV